MPKPRQTVGAGADLEAVAAAVSELQRLFGQGFTLGDPQPANSLTLARATLTGAIRPAQVVGNPDNINGGWCQFTVDTVGDLANNQNLRIYHGLRLPVPPSRVGRNQLLNVRWTVMGVRYNTDAAAPAAILNNVNVVYVDGAVDADWIDLRVWTIGPLVLAGANNVSLTITLFFWPASR